MLKKIFSPNAPQPVGAYSQAIQSGNLIFLSGQIPLDPKTGAMVSEDFSQQTKQVLLNIDEVLKAAGITNKNIIKCNVFLVDINNFATFDQIYKDWLDGHAPARAAIEVSALPKGSQIEIEAIATL